jgi:aspartyl/asparaginyl-tRNA synthetase
MKASVSVLTSAVCLMSNSAVTFADVSSHVTVSQSTVTVSTDADGGQVQSTSISIDRADLTQPHILRVQGSTNDDPIRMQRVEVKVNGKVVRSIVNKSLQLNLAPLLKVGRSEVEISGTSPRPDDTISVNFTGKNTQVSQQSSGTGIVNQILVINVR